MRSTCAWSQTALVHGSGSSSDMTLYPHTTRLKVSVCVSEQRECMREEKKKRERGGYIGGLTNVEVQWVEIKSLFCSSLCIK